MIHWRNRPIDRLTREELQQALIEAVRQSVAPNAAPATSICDSFAFGLFAGAALSLVGLGAAFVML